MDFRTELAKWGYNKGNSIDVDILVNEILPSLFSQQERSYSEEDMKKAFIEGHNVYRCVTDNIDETKEIFIEWFNKLKRNKL